MQGVVLFFTTNSVVADTTQVQYKGVGSHNIPIDLLQRDYGAPRACCWCQRRCLQSRADIRHDGIYQRQHAAGRHDTGGRVRRLEPFFTFAL